MPLDVPGTCSGRKVILYRKHSQTNKRTRCIIKSQRDDRLLMICTTAVLSEQNMTFLLARFVWCSIDAKSPSRRASRRAVAGCVVPSPVASCRRASRRAVASCRRLFHTAFNGTILRCDIPVVRRVVPSHSGPG